MFLKLDNSKNMKVVFQLVQQLKNNPERMIDVQTLTLDASRSNFGLKGSHGLFGTPEWWDNIKKGIIPLKYISGEIIETYIVGQDYSPINNGFTLLLNDGTTYKWDTDDDIKKEDKILFKIGATVQIVYALDERKRLKATGEKDYSRIMLEMAVSID